MRWNGSEAILGEVKAYRASALLTLIFAPNLVIAFFLTADIDCAQQLSQNLSDRLRLQTALEVQSSARHLHAFTLLPTKRIAALTGLKPGPSAERS
jgi:hypothetical protein